MKYRFLGIAGAIVVCVSSAAIAREADLLDFSAPKPVSVGNASAEVVSRDDALGENPFQASGAISADVVDAMRADFVSRGFDSSDFVGAAGVSQSLLDAGRSARGSSASQYGGSAGGYVSASFAFCEGSRYQRTWWLHPTVEARRERYFDIMAAIACEYQVPTTLLDAVITQESGYKSWAVSSAGAMGMMQIMPGTARYLGLSVPFDAVSNMRAGARYLKEQIDRFGRIDLALAAYNAGPHRRSLAAGYIPRIPETLNYVSTISTNWTRLGAIGSDVPQREDLGAVAAAAVRSTGYRTVELVRYDGLNASKPI